MTSITKLYTKIMCRFGWHRELHVIQSFGSAKHVGCPHCGRRFAMHDGLRAFLPWDGDFEQLYQASGYDTDAALKKWLKFRSSIWEGGSK